MDVVKQRKLCERYAKKHQQNIRQVYTDTSLYFAAPWAGRPEGVLCQLAARPEETIIFPEPAVIFAQGNKHFRQVIEYLTDRKCKLAFADGYNHKRKYKHQSDPAYIKYREIIVELKFKPVYYNHGLNTPPAGWQFSRRHYTPTLVANYEERKIAHAILDAYENGNQTSADLRRMLYKMMTSPLTFARAAANGFPLSHPGKCNLGREVACLNYQGRKNSYDTILKVLNGRDCTLPMLCSIAKIPDESTLSRVMELVDMGFVKCTPVNNDHNIYSRDWQKTIPCKDWSLYALEEELNRKPQTVGELSNALMFPRINVKVALLSLRNEPHFRVSSDDFRDKKSIWSWTGEPLNPKVVKQIQVALEVLT